MIQSYCSYMYKEELSLEAEGRETPSWKDNSDQLEVENTRDGVNKCSNDQGTSLWFVKNIIIDVKE